MNANLTIDKAGRIVLPKPVRDKLQILPGDQLKMETDDDRIVLRPARGSAQLRKKHGIWVYHSDEPLTAAAVRETLEQVRRERDQQNLGKL
jgi:AbrB family looped-hinge helix DNA binding protein